MLRCFVHSCPYEGNLRNVAKKKKKKKPFKKSDYKTLLSIFIYGKSHEIEIRWRKNEVKSFHVFREEISKYAKVKPLQPIWKLRKGK